MVPQTQQLILDYLLHNFEKYLPFYSAQLNPCQPWVSLSVALLSELVQFFDDGQFNRNVIDILVQIAADALNLNCFILQSNQGQIEVLNYKSGDFGEKFSLNSHTTTSKCKLLYSINKEQRHPESHPMATGLYEVPR